MNTSVYLRNEEGIFLGEYRLNSDSIPRRGERLEGILPSDDYWVLSKTTHISTSPPTVELILSTKVEGETLEPSKPDRRELQITRIAIVILCISGALSLATWGSAFFIYALGISAISAIVVGVYVLKRVLEHQQNH